jgi:hypothetical protein
VCVVVVVVGGKRVIIEPAARGGEVMWGERWQAALMHTPPPLTLKEIFFYFVMSTKEME